VSTITNCPIWSLIHHSTLVPFSSWNAAFTLRFVFFFKLKGKYIKIKRRDTETEGALDLIQLQFNREYIVNIQRRPTLINPAQISTQHERNSANPCTGAKPNYKKDEEWTSARIKKGFTSKWTNCWRISKIYLKSCNS
jgi:hypothetical protein